MVRTGKAGCESRTFNPHKLFANTLRVRTIRPAGDNGLKRSRHQDSGSNLSNSSSPIDHMSGAPRGKGWIHAFRSQMGSKAGVWWVTLLAVLLVLPTMQVGLMGDDFLFREIFNGRNPGVHPGAWFGLFTFTDGLADHNQALRAQGLLPWWVADHARMSFWRPLSELTHWVDHLLWPDAPALMHLQSIAWYGLLVFLLARFYRQLDPSPVRANLGALVFSVSAAHLLAVIWVAARNQLIAACMILLCLSAHHAWRSQGQRKERFWAWLWFACALCAAEAGIAAMAYLAAYAMFMDRGRSLSDRALSLLPYLLAVVIWRHQYNQWGYGSAELGGYIDPGQDPARFLHAMMLRLPSLLLAAVAGLSSTALQFFPTGWRPAYALMATAALGCMFWLTWAMGVWRSHALRFLAAGAVLALVPVCAAEVNDRLLLNAELGLSAVLGTLFVRLLSPSGAQAWPVTHKGGRRLVIGLAVVHLVVFPVIFLVTTLTVGRVVAVASHDEPMTLPDVPASSGQHMVLINPPSALFTGYFPATRRFHGVESGASMQSLVSGDQMLSLQVLDPYTIRIEASRGFGDAVSRDWERHPSQVGESRDAGSFVAKVERVKADGHPDVVRMRFKERLDDPLTRFYIWSDDRYVPFVMPQVNAAPLALGPGSVKKLIRRRFGLSH